MEQRIPYRIAKGPGTMDEPSVLDYLKEKINPRNWGKEGGIELPPSEPSEPQPVRESVFNLFAWKPLAALLFALVAQRLLEPTNSKPNFAIVLYIIAAIFTVLAIYQQEWELPTLRAEETTAMEMGVKMTPLLISLPLILLSLLTLKDNTFTAFNVFVWFLTIFFAVYAFWIPGHKFDLKAIYARIVAFVKNPSVNIHLSAWTILVVSVFLLSAFFHLSQIATVPLDMTSDHAEKLLDVQRILNGQYSIFMPNNGGREAMQFYIVTALIKWFGAGINMTTLKLSMGLMYMLGLIFVYLLGKEIGNRWTGLLAMLFLGIASWPNILERSGMRLVLVVVFVAPVLYFLFRGFRRSNRNDFVLSAIFLGVGLWGYTAFRIMPLVVALAIVVYVLHQKDKSKRKEAWLALGMMALISLIFFLPILRFAIQYPNDFSYRSLSRMTSLEVQTSANLIGVFFSNTWNALLMPFWKDGTTWVNSVTDRPALDVITAALYALGIVVLIYRWVKQRRWQDMFLLLSIPVLMLPSIMALAFPIENPSTSRAGGAVVPIILIAVIGLESMLSSLWKRASNGVAKAAVTAVALFLIMLSANQNYDLVFNQFNNAYERSTWNTYQMGQVCKDFIDSVGSPDTCYVSGLAYWADTRLVAIATGYPDKDFALWPENYATVKDDPRAKMFIVRANQTQDLETLHQMFPAGFETYHHSDQPDHDFISFMVPPAAQ